MSVPSWRCAWAGWRCRGRAVVSVRVRPVVGSGGGGPQRDPQAVPETRQGCPRRAGRGPGAPGGRPRGPPEPGGWPCGSPVRSSRASGRVCSSPSTTWSCRCASSRFRSSDQPAPQARLRFLQSLAERPHEAHGGRAAERQRREGRDVAQRFELPRPGAARAHVLHRTPAAGARASGVASSRRKHSVQPQPMTMAGENNQGTAGPRPAPVRTRDAIASSPASLRVTHPYPCNERPTHPRAPRTTTAGRTAAASRRGRPLWTGSPDAQRANWNVCATAGTRRSGPGPP